MSTIADNPMTPITAAEASDPAVSEFRENLKEWPSELNVRQQIFLELYSRFGSVLKAAEGVCHRLSHYRWLRESEIYRSAFEIAQALFGEKLKEVVIRQATDGIEEPVIYRGKVQVDDKGKVVTRGRFSQSLIKMAIQMMGRAWNQQLARLTPGSNTTQSNTLLQDIREDDRRRSTPTGPAPKKITAEHMGQPVKFGKRIGYELKTAT